MFHIEGGPVLQNGETTRAHAKLDDLGACLSRLRQMLGTLDGTLTTKSEAGDEPYSAPAFDASAESLLTDIRSDVEYLSVYLGQVADAISQEKAWQDADEADED